MNEIEKMYEKFKIERKYKCNSICYGDDNPCPLWCKNCENLVSFYPPFTAEKQIELIKWISRKEGFRADGFSIEFGICATSHSSDFEIALAKSINCFLEYCSSEEKEQIKEILR